MAMSEAELADNIKHRLMSKFPVFAPKGVGNVSVAYDASGNVSGMSFTPTSPQIPEWQARVFAEAIAEAVIEHLSGRMEIRVPVGLTVPVGLCDAQGNGWEGEGYAMGIEGHIS
jgi:hypothetical protein